MKPSYILIDVKLCFRGRRPITTFYKTEEKMNEAQPFAFWWQDLCYVGTMQARALLFSGSASRGKWVLTTLSSTVAKKK